MKRLGSKLVCLVVGLCCFLIITSVVVKAEDPSMMDLIKESKLEVNEANKPKSAILIDANTGKMLWSDNPDSPHNPASIMKLMTLYLVYDAMEEGRFNLDTKITATARDQQISGIYEISNNHIVEGVEYPVKELIPMALVPSSNVATMMLAELIEPDATVFLKKMNEKAKSLGMTHTTIVNATGAEISSFQGLYAREGVDTTQLQPEASNVTTARDFSIFTYHLLKDHSQILEFTNTPTVTTMKGTENEETFDTYNYSLPSLEYAYEGVDGLKTGSSPSGAFNIDMTAKRGELRLITIVFGVGDWSDQDGEYYRHPFSNAILDYGFNHFEYKKMIGSGEQTINDTDVIVEADLKDVVKKETSPNVELSDDGKIRLTNGLPLVSDTLKPTEVTYKVIDKSVIDKGSKKTKDVIDGAKKTVSGIDFSNPLIKWSVIVIGSIIVLILMLIIILIRSNKRRKKARRHRDRRSK